jgi:hypothetical protein
VVSKKLKTKKLKTKNYKNKKKSKKQKCMCMGKYLSKIRKILNTTKLEKSFEKYMKNVFFKFLRSKI